jgi:hypothetical protein
MLMIAHLKLLDAVVLARKLSLDLGVEVADQRSCNP